MTNHERTGDERRRDSMVALPDEWADTERDPEFPSADLGAFDLEQGLCLYDRDHPGQYLIGPGIDVQAVL